jgi:hypothetical protein
VDKNRLYPIKIDENLAGYFNSSSGKVHIYKPYKNQAVLATIGALTGLVGAMRQKQPKPEKEYVSYPVKSKEGKKITIVRYY